VIRYYIENDQYQCHLDTDKWSSNIRKRFVQEAKELAKEEDYPLIWCYVYKDKYKFMKHLGLTFVRNILSPDNKVIHIFCLNTEKVKCWQ